MPGEKAFPKVHFNFWHGCLADRVPSSVFMESTEVRMTLTSLVIHTGERALLSLCPQSKEKENHLIGLFRGASRPPQYTLCQQCLTRKLREIMPKMQGYLGLSLRNTLIETVAFMRVNSYQRVSLLQTQTPLSCVRVPC